MFPKYNEGKLKYSQFMFLMMGLTLGASLLVSFIDTMAQQNTWLIILIGYAAFIPFLFSYIYLMKRFPGKNIIEINDIVFGRLIGKGISALYVISIFIMLILNSGHFAGFYSSFFLKGTPQFIIIIVVFIVSSYAIYKGIKSIARIGQLSAIITISIVILTFLLLIGNMDMSNFFPVMEVDSASFIHMTHAATSFAFSNIFMVMLLTPIEGTKKLGRYTIAGISIAVLVLAVIAVRNTSVVGGSASAYLDVSLQAVRVINIGEFFSRIEIIVIIAITFTLLLKATCIHYATVKSLSSLVKLRSFKPLIIPIGILAFVFANIVFESSIFNGDFGANYYLIQALIMELIFPPATLLIAKLRKLPVKKEGVMK